MPSCCLQTQTVYFIKLKQKMFMKSFIKIKICLILVYIHKIQSFFDSANRKVIGKIKDKFIGKMSNGFIGLKSKMYSLVSVDGKENQKAKEVHKNYVKSIRHI